MQNSATQTAITSNIHIGFGSAPDILSALHAEALSRGGATAKAYLKALASFSRFLSDRQESPGCPSEAMLADWYACMSIEGLSPKTASYYFDCLHSLYNSLESECRAFTIVKESIHASRSLPKSVIDDEAAARVCNLARIAPSLKGSDGVFASIIIFSLLNAALDPSEIAMMKKEQTETLDEGCAEIAQRFIDPKRKYIFPLQQASRTPRQLAEHVNNGIISLLKSRGIPTLGNALNTLRSYWAYAAIRSGASGSETLVALGHKPVGLPALIPCSPSDADDFRIEALRYDIGRIFADNPFKWYAMRFRPGVRYADIKSRFEAIKDEITIPEVFFPCEEIAHKIGRKLVYENKPVIPDVLFFRSRVTDISPLFYRIGDLAWCYRDRSSATRAYAKVPESDMRAFQLAIGVFTPETEIYPIGCAPIYPDDIVKVIGGQLIGKTGVVDSIIEGSDSRPTLYRMILTADNGIEWRADVEPWLVEPASAL